MLPAWRTEDATLCRYITRPAIANGRLTLNRAGQSLPPPPSWPARSWAQLLKRVFDIDIEQCPQCGGALKIIAA